MYNLKTGRILAVLLSFALVLCSPGMAVYAQELLGTGDAVFENPGMDFLSDGSEEAEGTGEYPVTEEISRADSGSEEAMPLLQPEDGENTAVLPAAKTADEKEGLQGSKEEILSSPDEELASGELPLVQSGSTGELLSSGSAQPGTYVIRLAPVGRSWAEFYDLYIDIRDEELNTLFYKEFGNEIEEDEHWAPKHVTVVLDKAPATITVGAYYNPNRNTNDHWQTAFCTAPFETCSDRRAVCEFITLQQELTFCYYDIESLSEPLRYLDENGIEREQAEYSSIDDFTFGSGWYAVRGYHELGGPVITGDVNIVLCDDSTLSCEEGITVLRGATLTIWAQKDCTGQLIAKGNRVPETGITIGHVETNYYGSAAIGGMGGSAECGNIVINGGHITAIGGVNGAGIGGGQYESSGNITINGGSDGSRTYVTARGGVYQGRKEEALPYGGAGIGGGLKGASGSIVINGGTVVAEGGYQAAGIGGGRDRSNGPITINGGIVTATAIDKDYRGLKNCGAAIGAGGGPQGGKISINGGTVEAKSYGYGAGIGGSVNNNDGGAGGEIEINGKYTKVIAGSVYGAGIGSGGADIGVNAGKGASGGNITINNGQVYAISTGGGAGIGGGNDGSGGNITINDGYVVATGGTSKYIWSGDATDGKPAGDVDSYISDIFDGYSYGKIADLVIGLIFNGDYSGAGIGGGDDASGGTVTINGGTVIAKGGKNSCSAIGWGDGGSHAVNLHIYDTAMVTYGSLEGDDKVALKGTVQGIETMTVAKDYTYALIEPSDCFVVFDVDGKCEAPETQIVKSGSLAEKPFPDPAAEGYHFAGWYGDKEHQNLFDFEKPIRSLRTTVYAKWIPVCDLTVRKVWPEGQTHPEEVRLAWTDSVNDIVRESGTTVLSEENGYTASVPVTPESVLTIAEDTVQGFIPAEWRVEIPEQELSFPVGENTVSVSVNFADLVVQEDNPFEEDLVSMNLGALLAQDKAELVLYNVTSKTYSAEINWKIDIYGRFKPEQVKAALQHLETEEQTGQGVWTTIQTVTLSDENAWKAEFAPLADTGEEMDSMYRVRELDADGNPVLDSTDADGSGEEPAVTFRISPYTDLTQDSTYQVSYETDDSLRTLITNTGGKTLSVQINWETAEGEALPEKVEVELEHSSDEGNSWAGTGGTYLALSEENQWRGTFTQIMEGGKYRIREVSSGWGRRLVYDKEDVASTPVDPLFNKASYEITSDGETTSYVYDVAYEEDDEGNVVITNKRRGVLCSVEERWSGDWNDSYADIGGTAELQRRVKDAAGNISWETVQDDISLYNNNTWRTDDLEVPLSDGWTLADYRVRLRQRNRDYTNYIDQKVMVDTDDPDGLLLLAEDDEDNPTQTEPTFKAQRRYWEAGSRVYEDTVFYVSYEQDGKGTFIINNNGVNPAKVPIFRGHSAVMTGRIGVTFGILFQGGANMDASYMEFIVQGSSRIVRTEDAGTAADGRKLYTCFLDTLQLAEPIQAVLHYGDGLSVSQEYSLVKYIEYFDKHTDVFDDVTIDLIHALADYGHYAQIFLSPYNNWEYGSDYVTMAKYYRTSFDEQAIRNSVNGYQFIVEAGNSALSQATYSLRLDSETAIIINLKVKDNTPVSGAFSLNGQTFSPDYSGSGTYILRIEGVNASQYGDILTVTGDAGGEFRIQTSVLGYIRSLLNSKSYSKNTKAKNMVMAMYHFYMATMAYRSIHA